MNILVTLNDNYVLQLRIMLESLFQHEKKQMNIYLFYTDVSQKNRQLLDSYIKEQGGCFIPVFVKKDIFEGRPVCKRFPKEAYYRVLCSMLVPENEERILYLDPDIMIRGPISPLYEMDFSGKTLIAIDDEGPENQERLGLKKDQIYINSGVLLFNLQKMREEFVLEDFLSLLEKYREIIIYPDQDVINLYFKNKIKLVDSIYNYRPFYYSIRKLLLYALGWRKGEKNPIIVHYRGKVKPWHVGYYGKYFFEYFSYLKKYLTRKEKLLFVFKPCYVVIAMGKSLLGAINSKISVKRSN